MLKLRKKLKRNCSFSNDLITVIISCPCFFLIRLNIKKKHGQDVITVIISLEKLQTKYGKVVADIKYIKTCKKEHLIPMFPKVNISKVRLFEESYILIYVMRLC